MSALIKVSVCVLAFATSLSSATGATVRQYEVRRTATAPVVDGVISPGEWTAAGPAEGNWGELLQLSPPDADTAGNRFRMLWDDEALYLLYETNQTTWSDAPVEQNPLFDLLDEQLYLYLDPNRDREPNFTTNPDEFVDAYELAFNQRRGKSITTNSQRQGIGVSTEARLDSLFGDQANWNRGGNPLTGAAMDGIVIAQHNSDAGGLAELSIPWAAFDADANSTAVTGDYNRDGMTSAADYATWRDSLGQLVAAPGDGADGSGNGVVDQFDYDLWKSSFAVPTPVGDGLYHPFAPAEGDSWYFNIGQISNADSSNFMPVYNWTDAFFFAARPHAEITFVGERFPFGTSTVPEPGSHAVLCGAAVLLYAWRRGRNRNGFPFSDRSFRRHQLVNAQDRAQSRVASTLSTTNPVMVVAASAKAGRPWQ